MEYALVWFLSVSVYVYILMLLVFLRMLFSTINQLVAGLLTITLRQTFFKLFKHLSHPHSTHLKWLLYYLAFIFIAFRSDRYTHHHYLCVRSNGLFPNEYLNLFYQNNCKWGFFLVWIPFIFDPFVPNK